MLAEAEDKGMLVQARDISSEQNISKKFPYLIFFELRRHGLIQVTRGRERGYALAKRSSDISIAAIVRAVDGPLAPLPCASVRFYRRCDDRKDEKTCEVRRLIREVRDAAAAILDNTSLAQAAAAGNAKGRKLSRQPSSRRANLPESARHAHPCSYPCFCPRSRWIGWKPLGILGYLIEPKAIEYEKNGWSRTCVT